MLPTSALLHDEPSGLSYRTLPEQDGQPASGLLLLLHGVGGNETHLAELGRMADPGVRVALARGPILLGPDRFGWFEVRFSAQGPAIHADEAEASRLRLAEWTASLQQRHRVAPERTVIAGFSQGGIMSAGLGLTRPGLVAGFGLLSGRILPELAPRIAAREQLARLSAFVSHGREDLILPVTWADRSDAWLSELGVPHQTTFYPAGHELTAGMARDFHDWLEAVLAVS